MYEDISPQCIGITDCRSKLIRRAVNAATATIQNVRLDLCRALIRKRIHRGGAESAELEKFELRNSNFEILLCELSVSVVKMTSENRFSLFGCGSAALGKCTLVKLTFVL